MDFRLKVFKTVAEELSFTKASKLLFISQPAVTKHINELEKLYGCALFNRLGATISLTAEGKVFAEYATKIIQLYEALALEFSNAEGPIPQQINLAASTTIAQYILPSLFSKLKAAHPSMALSLINQNTEKIEGLVLQKKVALGLVEGSNNNPLLRYENFVRDEIVLVAGTKRFKSAPTEISLKQLKTLPLAIRERGSGTRIIIENALRQKGLNLNDCNIQIELGSTESIKNYLFADGAFAFLSVHSIARELRDGTFSIIEVKGLDIQRTFHFVSLHGNYEPASEWMKQFFIGHYNPME
ncbi:LysR family transcriptional regulator [Vitellibacter sp. q18]|nr:LysR family transcriptional regulator [Aequorivita lutea]